MHSWYHVAEFLDDLIIGACVNLLCACASFLPNAHWPFLRGFVSLAAIFAEISTSDAMEIWNDGMQDRIGTTV